MKRLLIVGSVLLVVMVLAVLLADHSPPASSLSKRAGGLLAARQLVELQGVATETLDRDPETLEEELSGTLVSIFPWRLFSLRSEERGEFLRRWRGTAILLYSGNLNDDEDTTFGSFDMPLAAVRDDPPVAPAEWFRYTREIWTVEAEAEGFEPLVMPAVTWVPLAPAGSRVLYRAPGGEPLVFAVDRGVSRFWVMPLRAVVNSSLRQGGNADLLASLAAEVPSPWIFDEHALGVRGADVGEDNPVGRRVFSLLGLHLLVLYGVSAWALGRRFGTPWREAPVLVGSTAIFLRGLGALHRRAGHHREVAEALVARSEELDSRLRLASSWRREAARVTAKGFLEWARKLAVRRRLGGVDSDE
ncbi:MAG: hypothetical protein AAF604_18675 [Acidobacteriota bacterium]